MTNSEQSIPCADGTAGVPNPDRRRFLSRLSLAAGTAGAALVGLPIVGFLLAPIFQPVPTIWRDVGDVENFAIGSTVAVTFLDASPLPWAGVAAKTAAWLRRTSEQEFVAFAINCSHLGCPVTWLPNANLFMCPCHGGVYNNDGTVAAGPPPKPLARYAVRVQNGKVQIQASRLPLTA